MKNWLYILFVAAIFTSSCNTSNNTDEDSGKLYIVTTTAMIEDAVKNIVGDKASVESLMGPGVDPHLYKPTQSDLAKLNEADAIFYNGLLLEGKMTEVLEKMAKDKPSIAVANAINEEDLIADVEHEGAFDPHIWHSIGNWRNITTYISEQLLLIDETNAELYETNTATYIAKLDETDAYIKEEFTSILPETRRVLITTHDAFSYYGKYYGIEVKGLQGISTAADIGLKDVTEMVDFIVDNDISAVFGESSTSDKSISSVIEGCREKGHELKIGGTLYSDAMGEPGTEEGTYIGMMKANTNTIVQNLK